MLSYRVLQVAVELLDQRSVSQVEHAPHHALTLALGSFALEADEHVVVSHESYLAGLPQELDCHRGATRAWTLPSNGSRLSFCRVDLERDNGLAFAIE